MVRINSARKAFTTLRAAVKSEIVYGDLGSGKNTEEKQKFARGNNGATVEAARKLQSVKLQGSRTDKQVPGWWLFKDANALV